MWHDAQATVTCAPVSGNAVRLWLIVAPLQVVVVWQAAQLVPFDPLWTSLAAWHATHEVGVPLNTPPPWHDVHATVPWAPVSGKDRRLWSKVESLHTFVVWHDAQSVP